LKYLAVIKTTAVEQSLSSSKAISIPVPIRGGGLWNPFLY
jgi:hypothetical protein